MDLSWVPAAAVGFASGYLSGQFGVGGGIITTPAIRLLLGGSELIAVGTSLPVVIPTALTGVIAHSRKGAVDFRTGLAVGGVGAGFSVLGAWATSLVGGDVVLVLTGALICWMAVDMLLLAFAGHRREHLRERHAERRRSLAWLAGLGVVTGLYSGFLGLGGGFVVVPALVRYFGFDAKRAVGTSLVSVLVLALPGSVTHYLLGHIDVPMALSLAGGVVPGALLGAHVTSLANERTVRIGFASLLLAAGALLAITEIGGW